MRLLIKKGRVLDPGNNIDALLDVLVEGGKIEGIAPSIEPENAAIIDASNRVIAPGLIDMHVHFRQPGQEYKETLRSGSRAAAKGGFATVVCEPNTVPPLDDYDQRVKHLLDIAKKENIINVYTKAGITRGMKGKALVDVEKVVGQGAVALSDDGFPVADIDLMAAAAREAKRFGIPICPHCGERRWEGSKEDNSEAEYISKYIRQVVKETACPFHFLHVSLAESLTWIAQAKEGGLPVTAEATPHHFTLTREDGEEIGPNAEVNPPLRSAEDVAAIKQALKANIIDVIATDHAPHAPYEKIGANPPPGIIGLETALGLVLTHLVQPGILSLSSAIEKMTLNPARILGLKGGELSPGMPADITIIDPQEEWVVDVKEFESKGRNCPFDGWKLKGRAVMTIVGGKLVMSEGRVFDPPAEDPYLWQPRLRELKVD
jgi:dihydroorotase